MLFPQESEYNVNYHSHIFAAWAASRAASVKNCRFPVKVGQAILGEWSFSKSYLNFTKPDITQLLPSAKAFDEQHRRWRNEIIELAADNGLRFTHGVAAKLINIYLKALYLNYFKFSTDKISAIHPPIDSVLLKELYKMNVGGYKRFWRQADTTRWSKFSSEEYEEVVFHIKMSLPTIQGLWTIEQYWQGYQ